MSKLKPKTKLSPEIKSPKNITAYNNIVDKQINETYIQELNNQIDNILDNNNVIENNHTTESKKDIIYNETIKIISTNRNISSMYLDK